jgi:TorA maturation chaperone TorD
MNSQLNSYPIFVPALSMARQALYRFASLSFLDPQAGAWQRLTSLRDDPLLFEAADYFRTFSGAGQESQTAKCSIGVVDPQPVLSCLPDSEQLLNAEYESTFGLLVSSNCPPYEMEYVNSKLTFQRSNTLADVSGFYRAFGMTGARPDRPDHIVLELEFMASLLGLERHAAASHSEIPSERLQVCHDAQLHFLRDHLTWWVPAFAKLLVQQNEHGFYAAAGTFLAAFLAAESERFGLPPAAPHAVPTLEERPEHCEGCSLAG